MSCCLRCFCRKKKDSNEDSEERIGDSYSANPDDGEIQNVIQLQPDEVVVHQQPKMKPKPIEIKFLTLQPKKRKKQLVTRSLLTHCGLLDDVTASQVQFILERSMNWRFNAFSLDIASGGRCLPMLGVHLFHSYGLISHFNLDPIKIRKLFTLIEEGYHSANPYHNAIHAADVTQAMHCFLQQERVRAHMSPIELMGSILAAMAHDLDHPGVNQQFLIATSNHLARLYENNSVLENHHWRAAMSCLIESGILDDIDGESQILLKNQISSLILATDITKQSDYLAKFKDLLDTYTLDMRLVAHRHLVLQIALKCADISNPCRPWDISQQWSMKVCEEFFRQGDFERWLNLPMSALCDRYTTSIPSIQTGFFKFVVSPLIQAWNEFLDNGLSSQMLNNLRFNQSQWESLAASEEEVEIYNDLANAKAGDDTMETGSENQSESSELLPLTVVRRSSFNPSPTCSVRQWGSKGQLRRFSVPVPHWSDMKLKEKADRSILSQHIDNRSYPENLLLSNDGPCKHIYKTTETVISSEHLLPETTIATITTDVQATRVTRVIKGTWKLVRQQTFPPLEPIHSLTSRSLHASKEDALPIKADVHTFDLTAFCKEGKPDMTNVDTDKTKQESVSESVKTPITVFKAQQSPTERPLTLFQTNLSSIQLGGLVSNHRRKSVPTDTLSPKEWKAVDALPHILPRQRTEAWTHRRGSAPAPIEVSDIRGLISLSPLCHSSNESRRTHSPMAACQQWLAKAQEIAYQRIPRRASLPVEVITGI